MTYKPIQAIDFGQEIAQADREQMLLEHNGSGILNAILQHLRDEWYLAVDEAVNQRRAGNQGLTDMALGSVDALSQAIVKLKAWSETERIEQ